MNLRILLIALIWAALCTSGSAKELVYDVNGVNFGPVTVTGTITTDGKIGQLYHDDVVGINITLSDGINTVTGIGLGGDYSPALSATTSGLFWNFDSTDFLFATNGGSSWFCLATSDESCTHVLSSEIVQIDSVVYQGPVLGGTVEIAVAAVPELPIWAMMLFGFASLGLARYRQTKRRGGAALAAT